MKLLTFLGYALLSRVLLILLSVSSSLYVGQYDTATEGLISLFRWDSIFFEAISREGYKFEHDFAFFPGLPLILRALGGNQILGIVFTNTCFLLAGLVFYKLTHLLFADHPKIVRTSLLLFVLNPANIFFTAFYTESPFLLLTLLVIYITEYSRRVKGKGAYIFLSIPFLALSALFRSNGIVNIGFLGYSVLDDIVKRRMSNLSASFPAFIIGTAVTLAVTTTYLTYAAKVSCWRDDLVWCHEKPFLWGILGNIPDVYSYIEGKYWDVGLFEYYTLPQIPNFLRASVTITLSTSLLIGYIRADPLRFVSLGILHSKGKAKGTTNPIHQDSTLYPYIVHLMALFLVGVLVMNVQVITRFLYSSTPVLLWYTASVYQSHGAIVRKFLLGYQALYSVMGTVLFSTFFPWT